MNTNIYKYTDTFARNFTAAGMILLMITVLSGCLQNYGMLRSDQEIRQSFESYQVPADLKYYYFGTTSYPTALIGINNDLTLKSRLWREVDPDTERFRQMVFRVWPGENLYFYGPRGSNIMDPEGKKVGIWYSYTLYAALKFSEDRKTIEVMPDPLFPAGI